MAIKPVDFQVMIPKTAEISRQLSENQQRLAASAQQNTNDTVHRAEDTLRQVMRHEQVEKPTVDEKNKEKGKKKQGQKGRENSNDNNEKQSGSIIDIKI